jgi:hypothetical protein
MSYYIPDSHADLHQASAQHRDRPSSSISNARRNHRDRQAGSSQSDRAGETSLEGSNAQMDDHRNQDPAYFGGDAKQATGVAATAAAANQRHSSNGPSNAPVQMSWTDAVSQSVTTTPAANISHPTADKQSLMANKAWAIPPTKTTWQKRTRLAGGE